jgi:ribosome recycling factor
VALRGCRRHARQELEALEKDKSISSDDLEYYEKILDKMTQEEVAVVDALLAHKEQELLEV